MLYKKCGTQNSSNNNSCSQCCAKLIVKVPKRGFASMEIILAIVGDFLENLEFLLLSSPNPLKRAAYFGILFAETPTYDELLSRKVRLAPYFELIDYPTDATPASVSPRGFEPPTNSLRGNCSTTELRALTSHNLINYLLLARVTFTLLWLKINHN